MKTPVEPQPGDNLSSLIHFYKSILDSLPAGLAVYDLEGKCLYANPSGVPDESLRDWAIGKTDEEYCARRGFDPDLAKRRREYQILCVAEKRMVSFEESLPTWEGKTKTFLRFLSPVIGAAGEINMVIGYGLDMTERKAADQALRESEERYRLLFEGSHDAIAVYGKGSRPVLVNHHFSELAGYSAEENREMTPLELVHPDDREMLRKNNRDRLAGKPVPRIYEFRMIHKSGRILTIEGSFDVIKVGDEILGIQGIYRDITERKRAEEALRESEERYRLLFEKAFDGISLSTPTSINPVLFNERFAELTGYSTEELRSMNILDILHPEDRQLVIENNRKRLAGRPIERTYEIRFMQKSGTIITVEAHFDLIQHDGETVGIQGIHRDVTERKKAEAALRESEERFRLLFENALDGIAVFGMENIQPVLFNSRFAELIGYSPEEIRAMDYLQIIHPEDREGVLDRRARRMKGEPVEKTYELRMRHKNGEMLIVEASFDLIRRGDEIVGIQGIFRDMTEKKQIQEALFEQQKEQSIVTLAGGIAHDFNNILLGVMGNAALLQEELSGQANVQNLVNNILTSSGRMADLTSQLLSYARGGKHRPEPSDTKQIILETLRMVHGSLSPAIQVECNIPRDVWPIEADRTQISQVLLNLVVNACEAMESRGVLKIDVENHRQHGEWRGSHSEPMPRGDYVHIIVADDGSGMTEETRRRLFEPFYTTKFMGRGLGLAAAVGIIRSHNGLITVESALGEGSTFHLYLPRSTSELAEKANEASARDLLSGLVLVIDDEETVRDVAAKMLKRMGLEVLTAKDGPEGIDAYSASIRLVILDIQMTGMSGAEVYSRLQEMNPNVRIIISSGYEESAATAGIEDPKNLAGFIKKPYTLAGLSDVVRKALQT
jgi:PAS domain S-box-containing protein